MRNAINHCELTAEIEEKMSSEDFTEAVMERAGQMILNAQGKGNGNKLHKLPGIELCAHAIAVHVVDEGARQVGRDLGVDLDSLKGLAASQHISSC